MHRVRYFYLFETQFVFSRQIHVTILKSKFHGNPSSGSRTYTIGRTDRQTDIRDEGNRRFSRLREKRLKYCIHVFNISCIKLVINVKGKGKSEPSGPGRAQIVLGS